MNINILRYSLFGIAVVQEVDHTFVKSSKFCCCCFMMQNFGPPLNFFFLTTPMVSAAMYCLRHKYCSLYAPIQNLYNRIVATAIYTIFIAFVSSQSQHLTSTWLLSTTRRFDFIADYRLNKCKIHSSFEKHHLQKYNYTHLQLQLTVTVSYLTSVAKLAKVMRIRLLRLREVKVQLHSSLLL